MHFPETLAKWPDEEKGPRQLRAREDLQKVTASAALPSLGPARLPCDGERGSSWKQLRWKHFRPTTGGPLFSSPVSEEGSRWLTFPLWQKEPGEAADHTVFPAYVTHQSFGWTPIQLQTLKSSSGEIQCSGPTLPSPPLLEVTAICPFSTQAKASREAQLKGRQFPPLPCPIFPGRITETGAFVSLNFIIGICR